MLVVDEYQDLGVALHRIVKRLAFDGGVRLFAVGDADQSIYGFTGADGALLIELAARSDIEPVQLQLNYRSGAGIVTASEMALEKPEAIKRAILRDKRPSNSYCARVVWQIRLRTPSRRSFRRP